MCVYESLSFKNMTNFRVNIFLVTDPDDNDNRYLIQEQMLRVCIWDYGQFNPITYSAMSERVHVDKSWMRFAA